MKAKWLVAGLMLLLSGLPVNAQEYKAGDITVSMPWARATPGGSKIGVAFLQITVAQGAGDRLVIAKSPVAASVEIHEHAHVGGVMKMRRVDGVDIGGGKSVTFKPGGYHLMLMELKQPLKQGEKLPLTLVFEKAGEISVEAGIASIGATGPTSSGAKTAPSKSGGEHKH